MTWVVGTVDTDDERTEGRVREWWVPVTLRPNSQVDSDAEEVLLHLSKMAVRQHRIGDNAVWA